MPPTRSGSITCQETLLTGSMTGSMRSITEIRPWKIPKDLIQGRKKFAEALMLVMTP